MNVTTIYPFSSVTVGFEAPLALTVKLALVKAVYPSGIPVVVPPPSPLPPEP